MGNTLMRTFSRGDGSGRTRDWAALPEELIGSIAERLSLPDHARLRAVCASWSSAARIYPPLASHFPWLMLNADDGSGPGSFLSLPDNRSYRLPGVSTTCVGSRDGWLVILNGSSPFLRNPVTGEEINLPSFDTLPWSKSFFDVRKIALSTSVAVAVFYSLPCCHLAFARFGDDEWTPLDFLSPPNQRIEDVVYHDNKFFIIFTRGRVQSFDLLAGAGPESSRLYGTCTALDTSLHTYYNYYLVSSFSGNLLQVRREKKSPSRTITNFHVMKFDPESESGWVEKKQLGNESLLLDNKCGSLSVSATGIPQLKRNCIYCVQEVLNSRKPKAGDLRIFDMDSGKVQNLLPANSKIGSRRLMPPVWFMPSII